MAESMSAPHKTLLEYIGRGEKLIARCQRTDIQGTSKLARKIQAEVKFLRRLEKKDGQSLMLHLKSTNLTHLDAIVCRMESLPDVTHVLKRYQAPTESPCREPVIVDIVCNHGYTWVKVIARKAEALHRIWIGDGQFGDKNLLHQALVYKRCSQMYKVNFTTPQLLFVFCQGVSSAMKAALEAHDVKVEGDVIELDSTLPPWDVATDLVTVEGVLDTSRASTLDDCAQTTGCWGVAMGDGDHEDGSSSSDDELLTATQMLQRQRGHHDLLSFIAHKERNRTLEFKKYRKFGDNFCDKSLVNNRNSDTISSDSEVEINCQVLDQSCPVSATGLQKSSVRSACAMSSQSNENAGHCSVQCTRSDTNMIGIITHSRDAHTRPANSTSESGVHSADEGICSSRNTTHIRTIQQSTGDGYVVTKAEDDLTDASTKQHDVTAHLSTLQLVTQPPQITKLCLDITTLISYISNLCHGHCDYDFREPILSQQAAQERRCPLLPILDRCFQDKELYICETALSDFRSILSTVGGDSECKRAELLLSRVTVIPDAVSPRIAELQVSAKIKERAKVIFGTAETFQAITVTANSGFVRAAEHKGICIPVILHESRALTEKKQAYAQAIGCCNKSTGGIS